MVLVQNSNDYRLEVVIDYQNGDQITQQELADAQSIEINYRWLVYDADDDDSYTGYWTVDGFGLTADNEPYVYYNAKAADLVPADASKLVGRVIIEDQDGLISKSQLFEILVLPDELGE